MFKIAIFADNTKWSVISHKGVADNGKIDLNSEFGVPKNVTAVFVRIDIGENVVTLVGMGETAGSTSFAAYTDAGGHDEWVIVTGLVPCDADGNIYITFSGTMDFIMYVIGYVI